MQGIVSSFDKESTFYRVKYDDEDSEELSPNELKELLNTTAKPASKASGKPRDPAESPLGDAATDGHEEVPAGMATKKAAKSLRKSSDMVSNAPPAKEEAPKVQFPHVW